MPEDVQTSAVVVERLVADVGGRALHG
jgi:hypothetical protein